MSENVNTIEVSEVVTKFKLKWKIVLGILVISTSVALFIALNLANQYRSEVVLIANSSDSNPSGGLGALAGQFGGLASLAGVNLGGGADKTGYALEVLTSRRFLFEFIQKHDSL